MNQHESDAEETRVEVEGAGDRRTVGFEPFDRCRSIAQRTMGAIGGGPAPSGGEQGAGAGPDSHDRCATMMARMMGSCCGARAGDAEPRDEKADACRGEPG